MTLPRLAALPLLAGAALAQLQPPPVPLENPTTPEKVVLGKALFWDEQLSSDGSVACGTCHLPEFGGADPRSPTAIHPGPDGHHATADDVRGSPGVTRQDAAGDFVPAPVFGPRVQVTGRLAPPTLGAAYHTDLFWDGRASTQFVDPQTQSVSIAFGGALESQAVGPPLSPVEMATEGRTWADVAGKLAVVRPLALASNLTPDLAAALQQNPTYPLLFAAAFGDPAITAERLAFAIASYERTLVPDDTPWDRFQRGQPAAMTQAETNGWNLFLAIGRCQACHVDPLFSDDQVHVLGLRPAREDRGRYAVTQSPFDDGAFKTPTLRNAGLRPRLFHNGQSPALGDPAQATDPNSARNVYFLGGGVDRSNLDPFLLPLHQLGVTLQDVSAILEFVRTGLTDPRAALRLPPFDHPDLRSAVVPPPLAFGQALAGASEPGLLATVPGFFGNADWKLGVVAGDGAGLAYLGYGVQAMPPGVTYAGLPWNVDVIDGRLVPLAGPPGSPGYGTWRVPIPADPALAAYEFFFQAWALDAAAPLGVATSRGTRFQVR